VFARLAQQLPLPPLLPLLPPLPPLFVLSSNPSDVLALLKNLFMAQSSAFFNRTFGASSYEMVTSLGRYSKQLKPPLALLRKLLVLNYKLMTLANTQQQCCRRPLTLAMVLSTWTKQSSNRSTSEKSNVIQGRKTLLRASPTRSTKQKCLEIMVLTWS